MKDPWDFIGTVVGLPFIVIWLNQILASYHGAGSQVPFCIVAVAKGLALRITWVCRTRIEVHCVG